MCLAQIKKKVVEMLECKYTTFISGFCLKYFYNDSFSLSLAQFWNRCLFYSFYPTFHFLVPMPNLEPVLHTYTQKRLVPMPKSCQLLGIDLKPMHKLFSFFQPVEIWDGS